MRYAGKLGLSEQKETSPGVWDETITEVDVVGTMKQRTETQPLEDSINPRIGTTTSVSVLSRTVGPTDRSNWRYMTHAGKRWKLSSIQDKPPSVVVFFGEEYHGPEPTPAP